MLSALLRLIVFGSLVLGSNASLAATAPSPLAGTWRIDLTRSTELSPWKNFDLIIAVDGATVGITRKLAWGRRDFIDSITIDTHRPDNAVPIDWWADNRHL